MEEAVGILNLRYGYYAMRGTPGVIGSTSSAWNDKKESQINEFYKSFRLFAEQISPFMTRDAAGNADFKIIADNQRNCNSLLIYELVKRLDTRFSFVVYSIEDDLGNDDIKGEARKKEEVRDLCEKAEDFQCQIFNVSDDLCPLSSSVMARMGDRLPFYLMDNATRSRASLLSRCKRWA